MLKKSSRGSRCQVLPKKSAMKNSQQWTTQMIQKIIRLSDNDGEQYLGKNSFEQLLVKIDKSHIEVIDKFGKYRQNGFNLLQFIRFFLNIFHHEQVQNLYLTIGLIDLFKSISTFCGQERLTFSGITNFLCEKILQKQQSNNQIQAKNVPDITFVNPQYQVKDFIRNPPTIYGSNDDTLYKLSPSCMLTDKSKHVRAISASGFSQQLKMVFTLDALSQYIAVYDYNCCQINKIYPSFSKLKKDVVILGFAFSHRQSRVGAVLKNFSIIFWDCTHTGNFDYEKSWSTTSHCQHLQSAIYYLEYFNSWITSDKTGTIYFWDLLNSKPCRQFKSKYYSSINVLCEISALNIIAIVQQSKQLSPQPNNGSLLSSSQISHFDKKNTFYQCNITLYNFFTGQVMNEISSPDDRVPHTIQYSEQYQILFAAGLQKKIKLWEINPVYMDSSLKGELVGHENLITSFTLIKKTSLLASCDDKGKIKLWDFKNFACIQTIDFSDKAMITNLLDMVQIGKIGILGSRIHYIDFQQKLQVIKKIKNKQKLTIEWIDIDQCRNEIYIFTQKDLRVLDMTKGCVKYIYGCFNSEDAAYTCFRYFACISKFAIGNDKGEVALYDVGTGAFSYVLKSQHEGSIVAVEYDQQNKLFITVGVDSSIVIHKESTKESIREMKRNFYGKQISCFELSVFHNVIAISTHQKQFDRSVFIWNYEFGKLSGEVKINKGCQVVAMQFINGYNILAIATSNGTVNLVRIKQLAAAEIRLEEMGYFELSKTITSLICDVTLKGGKKSELQQCILIVSFDDGSYQEVNITSYLIKLEQVPHAKQKMNYNPYRESKETFAMEYMKQKHFILEILTHNNLSPIQKSQPYTTHPPEFDQILNNKKQSQKVDTNVLIQLDEDLYSDYDNDEQQSDSYQEQNTYKEEVISIKKIQEEILHKSSNIITSIPVYSQPLSTGFSQLNILKLMNYEKRFIITVGNSKRLKIFTQGHKLICDLNINYPLPYLWNFQPKIHKKIQDKIYFAIKILNSILHKYQNDISVGQAKNYKLKQLFDCLNRRRSIATSYLGLDNSYRERQSLMLTQPDLNLSFKFKKNNQQQKIPLIQQEYTKNDLNYNLVKEYNAHEVAGPTLKQLDHIKKIQMLQKDWRQKEKQQGQDRDKLLKMIQTKVRKNQEKQQLSSFLSPSYKIKDQKETQYILNLRKKIDHVRSSLQKQQQIKEKDKVIPYLNTSKMLNFTLALNKNQPKKDNDDKTLMESCLHKYKSVKSLKRLNTTSTFEDYYDNVKDISNGSKLPKKISQTNQKHTSNFRFQTNKDNREKWNQTFGGNFMKDKTQTSTNGSNKLQKKAFSSGGKFRRILTEMNERVREKKIEKIRLV